VLVGDSLGVSCQRGEVADPAPGADGGPFRPGPRLFPRVRGTGRQARAGGCLVQVPECLRQRDLLLDQRQASPCTPRVILRLRTR